MAYLLVNQSMSLNTCKNGGQMFFLYLILIWLHYNYCFALSIYPHGMWNLPWFVRMGLGKKKETYLATSSFNSYWIRQICVIYSFLFFFMYIYLFLSHYSTLKLSIIFIIPPNNISTFPTLFLFSPPIFSFSCYT